MEFAQPPPNLMVPPPSIHGPPPNISQPPPPMGGGSMHPPGGGTGYGNRGYGNRVPFRPFTNMSRSLPAPLGNMTLEDFDGKRLRKSVMRKTVDYNSAIIKELETRTWQRDFRDRRALQPDVMHYPDLMPPPSYPDNPINCVTTRFVKTATNKMRCPIFCMAWTPEGRRLVTGASSGEFTLWNGLTFNFETILQAHDSPVRTMVWSHNDNWMVTGDHAGYVKYWQSNMNNVKMFQAHKEALRGISFSPTDSKFVTCSDDGTLRIWDFYRYQEERILRGHGADVKCCHWHPQKGLIISGSKDNQQPIKLWDPKSGESLATLHAHKSTVMDLKWNDNGNWLITASRDHLLKLFDLRNLSQEVQTFRGHKKEASSVAWHPNHEGLFSSGGSDGSIMFWHVGADKEVGAIEQAHDSIVWTLAWHPLGHILCSGSNDHTSKFWTRNRPGDQMRDKYNLNTLPAGITGFDENDIDEPAMIPGMGPEDKVELTPLTTDSDMEIPGLDLDSVTNSDDKKSTKKVPYSKPIPRNFQAQWNETGEDESAISDVISQIVENTPGVVPLQKITPNAIIIYGKIIPVEAGSDLERAISEGPDALNKYIESGKIKELEDVMPHEDDDYLNAAYVDTSDEEKEKDLSSSISTRFPDKNDADRRLQDTDFRSKGDLDLRHMGCDDDRDHDMRVHPPSQHRMFENDEEYRQYREQQMAEYNRLNRISSPIMYDCMLDDEDDGGGMRDDRGMDGGPRRGGRGFNFYPNQQQNHGGGGMHRGSSPSMMSPGQGDYHQFNNDDNNGFFYSSSGNFGNQMMGDDRGRGGGGSGGPRHYGADRMPGPQQPPMMGQQHMGGPGGNSGGPRNGNYRMRPPGGNGPSSQPPPYRSEGGGDERGGAGGRSYRGGGGGRGGSRGGGWGPMPRNRQNQMQGHQQQGSGGGGRY